MSSIPLWAQIVLVIFLLCCSAFFSISETSMTSINRLKIQHLPQKNKVARVLYLLDHIEDTLSVILIGNNLLNTVVTVLVTTLAMNAFGKNDLVLSVTTAIISSLIILFCEIIPKVLGATFSQSIALNIAGILQVLRIMFLPLIILIRKAIRLLFKVLSINMEKDDNINAEELKNMVTDNQHFNLKQRNVLHNFLELSDITINDVMTPKNRIEAINLDDDLDTIIEQVCSSYHNKLLVYKNNMNELLGILHIRNIVYLLNNQELSKENIQAKLIEPYYIPENVRALQQLELFQIKKKRLAIVVNEYGEIRGIVTLEDILEQVVGEFTTSIPMMDNIHQDEHGWYKVHANTSLHDIEKVLGVDLIHKATTINGLILDELGFIPDNALCFTWNDFYIEILQVEDLAVKTARIKLSSHMSAIAWHID